MTPDLVSPLSVLSAGGVVAGLGLLLRGFRGQRAGARIAGTGTSRIESLAAGEVRLSGVVEAAGLTLVSPLQSRPCVYYRARIRESRGRESVNVLHEERAIGFVVRDETGSIRVFPRGARWDVPDAFSEGPDLLGGEPVGLLLRSGSAYARSEVDRATAVAQLLTVHPAGRGPGSQTDDGHLLGVGLLDIQGVPGEGPRHYEEARVEPGDIVTIVGAALPFSALDDPTEADEAAGTGPSLGLGATDPLAATSDPEIAADLGAARAAGALETDPREAWGNAAIPGFGIGRPVSAPELDPAARPLPVATAAEADRAQRTFEIAPEALVVASAPGVSLLVAAGPPGVAVERQQGRFAVGLLGALLAIASAVVLALAIGGGLG